MEITLFSNNEYLCQCWEEDFSKEQNVKVCNTDYSKLPSHDCIVSPANSYGIMNGGLDLLIRDELGVRVQDDIQWYIQQHFRGCQPVGTSIVLETRSKRFKYIAHSPTMQRPQKINETLNSMHSFYATLVEVNKMPQIKTIACSGMGAGTGKLPLEEVSDQMYQAYRLFTDKFVRPSL